MKQNGKLVDTSNTTAGEQYDKFVQVSPLKIYKPFDEYIDYFQCKPWHHIAIVSEQYGLIYVWDTREIQGVCVLLHEDWTKLHHPADNASDLLLKHNTKQEIVDVIGALQNKLIDDDIFDEANRCRKQINTTCTDLHYKIDEQEMRDAMNMASVMAVKFWQNGWSTQFKLDDIKAVAMQSICEAMLRFNPTRGTVKHTKFTSYSYFWIRKYMQEYVTKHKSMLSGNLCDKYANLVPNVSSIDAVDDANYDGAGSDHLAYLVSDTNIVDDIIMSYQQKQRKVLFLEMLSELDPIERDTYCLVHGIDCIVPVNDKHDDDIVVGMNIRKVAKALGIRVVDAEQILQNATNKMIGPIADKYRKQFEQIND